MADLGYFALGTLAILALVGVVFALFASAPWWAALIIILLLCNL